jgi:hypothetical protein
MQNTFHSHDPNTEWAKNKLEINARTREFRTILSEMARLMQRVMMKGTDEDRRELKAIFEDTKRRMVGLVEKMDNK